MSQIQEIPSIQAFIRFLQFEKRYSPHTVRSYSDDLQQFVDYLIIEMGYTHFDPAQVRSIEVRNWLVYLRGEDAGARTLHRKISTLKSYYKFMLRQQLVKETPMVGIVAPKIPKRLPVFAKEGEMNRVLEERGEDFMSKTAHLLVNILYATGMRSSEVQGLKESQVDFSNKIIRVYGKGGKERILPMTEKIAGLIKNYISDKTGLEVAVNREKLLVKENGKPIAQKDVYAAAKAALGEAMGLEKRSPHVLRHTFATHLLNQGADLNAVKELLGHSSLAATQVYTHNTIDKLKEVHKKAHPRG
jgi:integrase/recombinase XerC